VQLLNPYIYICREFQQGDMIPITLFGDQLTCERVRSVHECRQDHETPEGRLEGFRASIGDFHETMNYLQV